MVDARKSMQASGQARDAAGRFKDENESNLGRLPAANESQREVDTSVAHVASLVSADPDTAEYEPWLTDRLSTLTAGASMSGEDDRDVRLIAANIQYDPYGPGGSRSDYLSSHVLQGFDGCNLEVSGP